MYQKPKCNNCGGNGHLFFNCKRPITSLGIVCFRVNVKGETEYLLIQRKDTLGYVDFLRGKYSEKNMFQLKNILMEMTEKEKTLIMTRGYPELWAKLWNKSEEEYDSTNRDKFDYIKKHNRDLFEIASPWTDPEWGFPKGRRNFKEKDIECALREFEEETGYDRKQIKMIENLTGFEEIFTGSNMKSYKHRYFLAKIPYFITLDDKNFQKSEVGNLKWMNYEMAREHIRPYNTEKLDILRSIHTLLEESIIF
jgi:8-oxo-dGTP pyrophosphatase MutT (NUDIX family)